MAMMPRRRFFTAALAAVAVVGASRRRRALAAPTEIKVPDNVPTTAFDFETTGIEGWSTTNNEFNVIVAPGSYADVDVSVKFKPISGREDASGGIVFRFNDGKYYVVRANALEDNFRLYTYDRGRRQLATARVKAPALGHWHTLRPVAVGDHIQAWLDGALHLDHHDSRFTAGRLGLWTKADSITAFDDVTVRGKPTGS